MPETYTLYVVDDAGKEHALEYQPLVYRNLMELIEEELLEEWGDCRGRAMCGTCHIEVLSGQAGDAMEPFEEQTLEGLPNKTGSSRLSCQITPDQSIHHMKFRILKDF